MLLEYRSYLVHTVNIAFYTEAGAIGTSNLVKFTDLGDLELTVANVQQITFVVYHLLRVWCRSPEFSSSRPTLHG